MTTAISNNHTDNAKELFKGDEAYIETYTGKTVFFMDPDPSMFDIHDIAHALSNNCRWTGHCKNFISVAEHSYWASTLVDPKYAMEALMHDASEAYLTDVAAPIKPYLTNYYEIEAKIMKALSVQFNFQYPLPKKVKQIDTLLLSEEAYQVVPSQGKQWKMWESIGGRPEKRDLEFGFWTPEEAEEMFMFQYYAISRSI